MRVAIGSDHARFERKEAVKPLLAEDHHDDGGERRRLIAEDGVRGVTSNPAIFERAVAGGSDHRQMLEGVRLFAKAFAKRLQAVGGQR